MTQDAQSVTQADRTAAADLLDELSSLLDHNGIGQVADLIRDGEYDEHEAADAFRRHRLASQPTSAEDSVAWQWRACEDGSARTAWYPVGYGDEKDWQALAKSNSRFAVERRALYARPTPAQTAAIGAEAMSMFEMAHALIQEAKGGAGDEAYVTNHLDDAEHWLYKAEALLSQPVAAPQAEKRVEDGHADTEGEAIERFAHLNCPACGGSGHVDDVTPPQPEGGTVEAIKAAWATFENAMKADPEYAWAWHCNLAMPIMDAIGCTHEQANKAGAHLMDFLWKVDITQHPHFAALQPEKTNDQ